MISKEEWEETERLILQGLTNKQIGERLFIGAHTAGKRRIALGYRTRSYRPRLTEEQKAERDAKYMACYNAKMRDAEAARECGCSISGYTRWRHMMGLPRHKFPRRIPVGFQGRLTPEEQARRLEVAALDLTDQESAERLGIPLNTYTGWRIRNGILKMNREGKA